MNTQELRRLGVLPYEEEENRVQRTWHTGVVRPNVRTMNMTIERVEVNAPSRRMLRDGRVIQWEGSVDFDAELDIDGVVEDITAEIDQEIIDSINQEAQQQQIVIQDDQELVEQFGQPEESTARRAWRSFIERFR